MNFLDRFRENSQISNMKIICHWWRCWMLTNGQTESWTDNMKLTAAYQCFGNRLKYSLKI